MVVSDMADNMIGEELKEIEAYWLQ